MKGPAITQKQESFNSPTRLQPTNRHKHQADHLHHSSRIHKNHVRSQITYVPVDQELLLKLPGLSVKVQKTDQRPHSVHQIISSVQQPQGPKRISISQRQHQRSSNVRRMIPSVPHIRFRSRINNSQRQRQRQQIFDVCRPEDSQIEKRHKRSHRIWTKNLNGTRRRLVYDDDETISIPAHERYPLTARLRDLSLKTTHNNQKNQ